jgi:hypothetical protein
MARRRGLDDTEMMIIAVALIIEGLFTMWFWWLVMIGG